METEQQLVKDMGFLKNAKTILDVACGDGRNTIYLAKKGYEVTGVDFSHTALERLAFFCKKENINIDTRCMDLADSSFYQTLETYDVIIVNHCRLASWCYSLLAAKHLKNNGILWINGHRKLSLSTPDIKEKDLIRDSDFEAIKNVTLLNRLDYDNNNKSFSRYIFLKS